MNSVEEAIFLRYFSSIKEDEDNSKSTIDTIHANTNFLEMLIDSNVEISEKYNIIRDKLNKLREKNKYESTAALHSVPPGFIEATNSKYKENCNIYVEKVKNMADTCIGNIEDVEETLLTNLRDAHEAELEVLEYILENNIDIDF